MFDKVKVLFKEEDLGYKKKTEVLTGGGCKGILPLSIVRILFYFRIYKTVRSS